MYELVTPETPMNDPLSIARRCQALSLSRADYYRHQVGVAVVDPDVELRDQIQRIALEMPAYGYRRITAELRRRGMVANHKRVRRLMRNDNRLCLRHQRFIRTTDSDQGGPIYPNLLPDLIISGLDHLWVADIASIRRQREFIYRAVILDAFSRRGIGWALDRTLEAELALAALERVLKVLIQALKGRNSIAVGETHGTSGNQGRP